MNTHINIHLVKSKTDLRVTYRDGRFLQIKKLRGTLDATMTKYIGYVIPPQESDLKAFITANLDKVVYTTEAVKSKTLLTQFTDVWFVFFRKENNGISPKHVGVETNALKAIITHFKRINNGDEAAALANWNLLLENWSELSEFHQKQMDLKYINSKLNVIIREIIKNNGDNTSGTNGSVSL